MILGLFSSFLFFTSLLPPPIFLFVGKGFCFPLPSFAFAAAGFWPAEYLVSLSSPSFSLLKTLFAFFGSFLPRFSLYSVTPRRSERRRRKRRREGEFLLLTHYCPWGHCAVGSTDPSYSTIRLFLSAVSPLLPLNGFLFLFILQRRRDYH